MKKKKIFLSVGEVSGDIYGANIVERLPEFEWIGITGPNLRQKIIKSIENIENISVVGLTEVIPKYKNIKNAFKKAIKELDKGVDLLITIDFPGFNLKLLKEAKKRGIKTIYFIPPQVWAWGQWRIKKIVKYTDLLITIFPFEKEIYKKYEGDNFSVEYFGHPLIDIVNTVETLDSFKNKLKIDKDKQIFGLLAGSRENEVKVLLPILLQTANLIYRVNKNLVFIIPTTENQFENVMKIVKSFGKDIPLKIITKNDFQYPSYEVMKHSVFSLIASGTATLEASIISNPFAIVYKVSPITYFIGKKLVSINNIGLPNIIAGKEIIKEFLQEECNPIYLANYSLRVMYNELLYKNIKNSLKNIRFSLGKKGVLDRIAKSIKEFIS